MNPTIDRLRSKTESFYLFLTYPVSLSLSFLTFRHTIASYLPYDYFLLSPSLSLVSLFVFLCSPWFLLWESHI